MQCVLCHSSNVKSLETIKASDLIAMYKKAFKINVESILKQDLIYWHCKDCDLRFFSLLDGSFPCGDNDFYNALNKLEWYYMSEKYEYHFAKKFINATSKIIEVGCGKAAFSHFIPNKANYVGLELSSDAKKMALDNDIHIENSFIEDFAKTHKKEFDVACSFQVLEHTSDPNAFIRSQIECLNRGGQLLIAVPSEESFIHHSVNAILNMPPHHILRFSDKCLKNIACIFDLELVEIYHECVQNEHIDYYKATMWAKLFLKTPLIDRGILRKIINKCGIFGKKIITIPKNAYGHTVVAVYRIKK